MADDIIKATFYITYVLLITTGTITFIEAIRSKDPVIRHIMNLETCVSIIAAFFYGQFLEKLKDSPEIPYDALSVTRYTDWFISTPFMLLVLCIFLAREHRVVFRFHMYFIILLLNVGMLSVGYMGETRRMDKNASLVIGFAFFAALFGYVWHIFMTGRRVTKASLFTYWVYIVVWALYGVVFVLDAKARNVSYNVLDLIAKCLVGIFFWMYFTSVMI